MKKYILLQKDVWCQKIKVVSKTIDWKRIQTKLILEHCLVFGQNSKFTSKKISRFLLGTRAETELFKLYELRLMLLRIYPLIHNLFYNPRLNFELETKKLTGMEVDPWRKKKAHNQPEILKPYLKFKSSFTLKRKPLTPQILFATITPAFGNILQDAADVCNMPVHKNRWLNGSITAAISYPLDDNIWNYPSDSIRQENFHHITKTWGANKADIEHIKEKIIYHGSSRWPSLLIIPDISNNNMIIREAKAVNLPIIGLVNSDCQIDIDYPIFAQDQTIPSVFFFCHFLARLIAKEVFYIQHKRSTMQNTKRCPSKKALKKPKFLKIKNAIQKRNQNNNKTFFFQNVKNVHERRQTKRVTAWNKLPSHFLKLENRANKYDFSNCEFKERGSRRLLELKELKYHERFHRKTSYLRRLFKKFFQRIPSRFTPKLRQKYLPLWYSIKKSKLKLIWPKLVFDSENRKKIASSKKFNSWTIEDKGIAWKKLRFFLIVQTLSRLQKKKTDPVSKWGFNPRNGSYYWNRLQHWSQETKWQNHEFIINDYMESSTSGPKTQSDIPPKKTWKKKIYYKKKTNNDWKKKPWNNWKKKALR